MSELTSGRRCCGPGRIGSGGSGGGGGGVWGFGGCRYTSQVGSRGRPEGGRRVKRGGIEGYPSSSNRQSEHFPIQISSTRSLKKEIKLSVQQWWEVTEYKYFLTKVDFSGVCLYLSLFF